MRVTIRCEYPGTDIEPTAVEFVPAAELGDTPEAVHTRIVDLLRNGPEEFKLPAVGEKWPLPFHRATVRRMVVR